MRTPSLQPVPESQGQGSAGQAASNHAASSSSGGGYNNSGGGGSNNHDHGSARKSSKVGRFGTVPTVS